MNSSGHMYCTSCGVGSHKSPQSQERRRLPPADLLPTPCSWHGTSPRTARPRYGRSPATRVHKTTKKKLFPPTCALTHVNWSGLSWTTATRPGRPFQFKFSILNIVINNNQPFRGQANTVNTELEPPAMWMQLWSKNEMIKLDTWGDLLISEVQTGDPTSGRLDQLLEEELWLVAGLQNQLVVLVSKNLVARP